LSCFASMNSLVSNEIIQMKSIVLRAIKNFDPEVYYRTSAASKTSGPTGIAKEERYDVTLLSESYWDVDRFAHLCRYHIAQALFKGKHILDVGCGTGYGVGVLTNANATTVTGIDISAEAITYAKGNWGDKASFIMSSSLYLPFNDESFDVVTCFEHYEHIAEQMLVLKEIHRVLRPGGYLMISTPNLHNLLMRLKAITHLRALPKPGPSPRNRFHLREVPSKVFVSEIGSIFRTELVFGQYIFGLRPLCCVFDFHPSPAIRRGTRAAILAGFHLPHISGIVVLIGRKI